MAIIVANSIHSNLLYSHNDLELLVVNVSAQQRFTIACMYLPPSPSEAYEFSVIEANALPTHNDTSTFIECRGEPELIFVQFDNSIIIKHQQYLSTDLFSRSFTLMFNSLVSLCSALSTDLFSRSFTLMFNSLVSLCSALSTDLATRARTLFFCSLTARSSVAVSPSVCSVVAAIFRLCR